jgi:hypothetical protein
MQSVALSDENLFFFQIFKEHKYMLFDYFRHEAFDSFVSM